MAWIEWSELVALVKKHPKYLDRLERGVPAEKYLYISFAEEDETPGLVSDVFEVANGSELMVNRDKEGKVWGIEIG